MSHTAEGSLQMYLDGEMDGAAAAALDQHVAACDACARELESLRALNNRVRETFALLPGSPAPMLRARAAVAAARRAEPRRFARFTAGSLAKAAALLLVLTGAAAAIPGSPVRRALESTLARLFPANQDVVTVPQQPVAPDATPVAPTPLEEREISIRAASGAVRVLLHAPEGAVNVTVRLEERDVATVETSSTGSGVRFSSATGRVEVSGMESGSVTIRVPRDLQAARIEVNGTLYAYKQSDILRLTGPAGTMQGTEVKFRIEP